MSDEREKPPGRIGRQAAQRADERFADIYTELRDIARREHRRNPSKTLNTTAVVHEAWLRLRERRTDWSSREHFLSVAALAMRHVLVDYARYRNADRRDVNRELPLFESAEAWTTTSDKLLAVDSALKELEELDPRLAQLVVLRFFGGLSVKDAGQCLDISARTAARDWNKARAFLKTVLAE